MTAHHVIALMVPRTKTNPLGMRKLGLRGLYKIMASQIVTNGPMCNHLLVSVQCKLWEKSEDF